MTKLESPPPMANHKAVVCDLSVVIPARNEEGRLLDTLEELNRHLRRHTASHEIIVVNDGSQDDTANVAESWGARLVNHTHHKGIAAAFKSGAKVSQGRVVMLCPADIRDFSFLKEAIEASQASEVVSVSKRHPRSVVLGYGKWRWFLSNCYHRCVSLLFGPLEICTDTHYVKLYDGKLLRSIADKCKLDGPVGETEIMLYFRDFECTFYEVPARIVHEDNCSKTSFTLILQTITELAHLWIHRKLHSGYRI